VWYNHHTKSPKISKEASARNAKELWKMDLRVNGARAGCYEGEVESAKTESAKAAQPATQAAQAPQAMEEMVKAGVQPRRVFPDIATSILKNRIQTAGLTAMATATTDPKLAATKMSFSEDMKGNFAFGDLPYAQAEQIGKQRNQAISFHANMKIDNMDRFLNSPGHEARIEGYINYPPLGGQLPITSGKFNLFAVDPDTGDRQMRYQITFKGKDGKTYLLDGIKNIKDEAGFDVFSDNTTLFTKIYEGGTTSGRVVSTGVMHISLWDTLRLVQSINVQAPDQTTKLKALSGFGKFFMGTLFYEYVTGKLSRLFSFLKF
jgi:hypothetical protein